MSVNIKLDIFEGPFDLLFHLIEKEEINIYDIPIAEITEQYLNYLAEMMRLDLEVASEFLVMAATLLAIKARMLLPKTTRKDQEELIEEEDPRAELVEKLLEYKKYKAAAEFLKERAGDAAQAVVRPDESEYFLSLFGEAEITGVTLEQIARSFANILKKVQSVPPVIKLSKRIITVADKMDFIMQTIKPDMPYAFLQLLEEPLTRSEIIMTFLAVLELIKQRKVFVRQDEPFGEILLFLRIEEGEANIAVQ